MAAGFIHWQLAGGTAVEVVSWLVDHSRLALSVTAHPVTTGEVTLATFRAVCQQHGAPASSLTDNGSVYAARFVGGRNGLENELRRLGVKQKNGSPNHPQTQGKVECTDAALVCTESTRRAQFSRKSFHEAFHATGPMARETVTESDDSAL